MITCDDLLDRMPEVVAGRVDWSAEEAGHLAGCVECRRTLALMVAGRTIGVRVAERVVPSRVAEQVRARLARERRSRLLRRAAWTGGLAVAASLALVVFTRRQPEPPSVASAETRIPVAELDSLTSSELEAVYEAMDAPLVEGSSGELLPPSDLNTQQLERVLRSLEG